MSPCLVAPPLECITSYHFILLDTALRSYPCRSLIYKNRVMSRSSFLYQPPCSIRSFTTSFIHGHVRWRLVLTICPDSKVSLTTLFKRARSTVDAQTINVTPCLDDYEFLRTLGTGANATVYLVREKHTANLYAVKAVDKYTAGGRKIACSTVINEQAALRAMNGNDFILPLHACFHDTENYYLVTVSSCFHSLSPLTAGIGIPPWR